jgi:hypothetical protein
MIRRVYAHFRKTSDGCDGASGFGFNGCLSFTSLFLLFHAIGVRGRKIVDIGAGEGRVLASAMKCGAKSVVGYELPANSAHKYVYDAVLRRIFVQVDFNFLSSVAQWLAKDIQQVLNLVLFVSFFPDGIGSKADNFAIFRSMSFLKERKLSILFGMACPLQPKFTFSNFQPAAKPYAQFQFFEITNGVRLTKVFSASKVSFLFQSVAYIFLLFSLVLRQWFKV